MFDSNSFLRRNFLFSLCMMLVLVGMFVGGIWWLHSQRSVAVKNIAGESITSTMTDSRDGQIYKTVQIGSQTWMAENLNVKTVNSICIDADEPDCKKYGRLYTWKAAKMACPVGWHLPSESDFKTLIVAIGGRDVAGGKLKSMAGWNNGGNGMDAFSFAALPAGIKYDNGFFNYKGKRAFFWSSTDDDRSIAYDMYLDYGNDGVGLEFSYKEYAYSVRCIKD